jgi:hypothetical protein
MPRILVTGSGGGDEGVGRRRRGLCCAAARPGEGLRCAGRRVDARQVLREAYEALTAMGAEAFAERARRELSATEETVRRRTVEAPEELTPQEAQIARLARGTRARRSPPSCSSARAVDHHPRKTGCLPHG